MFKTLYERYVIQLTNQAYKLLQDVEISKDVVQDVFLNFYNKRKKLPANLNAGAYLNISVKHKSLNVLRDIKLKEKHHQHAVRFQQERQESPQLERLELQMELNKRIELLPERCKEVFFLRHYENKSYKEISTHMGISSKTVEKHISKAVQLLKEKLKIYGK